MAHYTPQITLQYVTFIKRAITESLQQAFKNHPDPTVAKARVAIDFGHDRWRMPGVIIKYYERELPNAGVGHVEYLPSPQDPDPSHPSLFIKYYHRMYKGDVAFDIYAMSSIDRDLIRDGLIEVLAMTDVTGPGENFINRFYNALNSTPYGLWHFPVLNLDKITGYGEQAMIAPWEPEDMLVYQASYRVPIFGEFYSTTPTFPSSTGLLEEVDIYPYLPAFDPTPEENPDVPGAPGWYRFKGWPSGASEI